MAFLEDPRLRQRWNQISHNAEAVTENAAAGIWTFQHRYINPCMAAVAASLDSCTAVCFGDREERARRQRERERGARPTRAEYSFDFYDDWDDDDDALASSSGDRGLLGTWKAGRAEQWDRLLAGTGSARGRQRGDTIDQPRRKKGMSYGTAPTRRKTLEQDDPTVIPSTAPIGFLGRLPFKIGGTLRYKPSAANLKDNPGGMHLADEHEPLLGSSDDDYSDLQRSPAPQTRKRSGTAGSGDTSSSFRSRNDLFPSDGEGEEDAVPLDDEFAVVLDRMHDDRSSGKTRSSKGKRRADSKAMSRSLSRTTMSSGSSLKTRPSNLSLQPLEMGDGAQSLERMSLQEEALEGEEEGEVEQELAALQKPAAERGHQTGDAPGDTMEEVKPELSEVEEAHDILPESAEDSKGEAGRPPAPAQKQVASQPAKDAPRQARVEEAGFVPARLPSFT
jgi:hypothetical protein